MKSTTKTYVSKQLATIEILLAAILWGIIGLFTNKLLGYGFNSGDLVAIRSFGACITLFLLFLIKKPSLLRPKRRNYKYFIGTGIISFVLFNWCYFSCIQKCSLSIAAILLYTAPTFVVILSTLLFHEKLTKKKIIALCMTFLGCILVTNLFSSTIKISKLGILFGIGSGLFYGLYSIFGSYALKTDSPETVTSYTFLFASFGSIVLIKPESFMIFSSKPVSILFAVLLILLSTVLPFLLYTKGLQHIEAGKASIMATLEPVIATIVSVAFLGEALSISSILGILFIILSIVILSKK